MRINTLSVILTVYNLEDCIEETLGSLESQRYDLCEVLIIDDGSTDKSTDIIRTFLVRHNNWKIFQTSNQGVSSARNLGFLHSKGDYVLFLDGDDLFREDFLFKIMEATANTPDVVVCKAREYDHSTGLTTSLSWGINNNFFSHEAGSISPADLGGTIFYSFMGWPWDKIFRREHIENNRLYFPNLKNSEDLVFVYPALYLANKINIVEEELIFHRINRKTSKSNNIQKYPLSILQALTLSFRTLKDHPIIYKREQKAYEEWALDMFLWGWRQISVKDIKSREKFREFYFVRFAHLICERKKSDFFPFIFQRAKNFSNCNSQSIENFYYFLAFCSKYGLKRLIFRVVVKFKIKLLLDAIHLYEH